MKKIFGRILKEIVDFIVVGGMSFMSGILTLLDRLDRLFSYEHKIEISTENDPNNRTFTTDNILRDSLGMRKR